MDDRIKRFLGDPAAGLVSSVRPQQLAFATHVADVFDNGGIAMLEAATGVGKSFGYITPALLDGRPEFRVVISTAKKALQSQLFRKDLPRLTQVVQPARFAMLKGKSNYVCQLRLDEFLAAEGLNAHADPRYEAFVAWAESDDYGDIEMFGEDVDFAHRVRITECVRKHCPHALECGYVRNKGDAARARVLVVNHALLAHDLRYGGGRLLGDYNALVIDEAHQFPSAAREAHTFVLSERQVYQIEQAVGGDVRFPAVGRLKAAYRALFNELARQELGKVRLIEPTYKTLLGAVGVLSEAKREFQACGLVPEDADGVDPAAVAAAGGADAKTARHMGRLTAVAALMQRSLEALQRVVTDDDEDADERVDYLPYLRRSPRDELELAVAPVEVGPLIAPALVALNRVVLTSATLATGENFNFMAREFGLSPKQVRVTARLPSPFPRNRSTLYVSPTAPQKEYGASEDYYRALCAELAPLLEASRGGAFVLCASRDDMNGIYGALSGCHPSRAYEMACQTANVANHVAWFKERPNRVLIGMKSIWEGVDVPGLGLRLVVIPRIPFPNTKEPLMAARRDRIAAEFARQGVEDRLAGIRAFMDFDVQIAAMDIAQGAGRLIRSEGDMGVVAVLDPRMHGARKGYSGVLRATVAKPFTDDYNFVVQFLSKVAERALREHHERPAANP